MSSTKLHGKGRKKRTYNRSHERSLMYHTVLTFYVVKRKLYYPLNSLLDLTQTQKEGYDKGLNKNAKVDSLFVLPYVFPFTCKLQSQ